MSLVSDLLNLIDVLDHTRASWQKAEAECKLYKTKVVSLEKKASALQEEVDTLKDVLRHCRAQYSHISDAKKDVESELAEHKRIIDQ